MQLIIDNKEIYIYKLENDEYEFIMCENNIIYYCKYILNKIDFQEYLENQQNNCKLISTENNYILIIPSYNIELVKLPIECDKILFILDKELYQMKVFYDKEIQKKKPKIHLYLNQNEKMVYVRRGELHSKFKFNEIPELEKWLYGKFLYDKNHHLGKIIDEIQQYKNIKFISGTFYINSSGWDASLIFEEDKPLKIQQEPTDNFINVNLEYETNEWPFSYAQSNYKLYYNI
jgi:hypothetical protein